MREKRATEAVRLKGKPAESSSRKAKVTDEHRREAVRLKELFQTHQLTQMQLGRRVTQGSFGADYEIGSQGLVTQYLNGIIPLNLPVAVAFAKGIGCKVADFSPRLASEQADLAGKAPAAKTSLQSVLELTPIEQQLLGLYRDLKPEHQDEVIHLANKLHTKTHTKASPANPFPDSRVKEGAR
jgi:transcriptional regulator with XRE-family HTH domain